MEDNNIMAMTTSQEMRDVPDSVTSREKKADSTDKSRKQIGSARVYVHVFEEPFTYEDQTYTKIKFDFGKLKGKDATSLEDELAAEGRYVISPELSDVYLSKVAVRASDPTITFDAMEELPYVDFKKIINAARDFLVRSGL
ncbi:MAG: hypothetical protein NC331_13815 [Lachnospiraceae bacterium]|nr:hypothetical protein [Lachnospiraceae bacterium]MCM1240441.1 hypothetical protein [Lachnospiraceae bacterium]